MIRTLKSRSLAIAVAVIMVLALLPMSAFATEGDGESTSLITITDPGIQMISPGVDHYFELSASGVETPIDGVKPVLTITGPAGDGSSEITVGSEEGNWNVCVYGSDNAWHPISLWEQHGFQMDSTSKTKIKVTAPASAALGAYTYSLQLKDSSSACLLTTPLTGTLMVIPAVELGSVALTAGSNLNLVLPDEESSEDTEPNTVTFTAAASDQSPGIVRDVAVSLTLQDGADAVTDWTTFFDAQKSEIKYGEFGAISLAELTSGTADLYMGEATITLVPNPVAAGHSFTYTVTVSKGESESAVSKSAIGSLKVEDPAIVSLTAGSNTSLSASRGGTVTFAATLDPAVGIVTGVNVALNLKRGGTDDDWKTYFDEDNSTIQYGDFLAIPLKTLTTNLVDLYPSDATITLVPKSAAAGLTFTYTVTVSKGTSGNDEYVTAMSNEATLTVASVSSGGGTTQPPTDEPPVDEPPVDEPPVDEPPVDEPPVDEPADTDDGWVQKDDGTWEYLVDGEAETGWVKDGSTWYYLNTGGIMETGWERVNGAWYYLASSGAMKTGWVKENNTWYYLASSGAMKTGWVKDKNVWYYLSGNGAMVANKWLKDTDGSWYYLAGSGTMLTGTQKIGAKTYTFKANGVWIS